MRPSTLKRKHLAHQTRLWAKSQLNKHAYAAKERQRYLLYTHACPDSPQFRFTVAQMSCCGRDWNATPTGHSYFVPSPAQAYPTGQGSIMSTVVLALAFGKKNPGCVGRQAVRLGRGATVPPRHVTGALWNPPSQKWPAGHSVHTSSTPLVPAVLELCACKYFPGGQDTRSTQLPALGFWEFPQARAQCPCAATKGGEHNVHSGCAPVLACESVHAYTGINRFVIWIRDVNVLGANHILPR